MRGLEVGMLENEWEMMEAAYRDWLQPDSDDNKKRHNIALCAVIQQLNNALPKKKGEAFNKTIVDYCVIRLEQLFDVYTSDLERGRIMLERGRGLYALGRVDEAIIALERSTQAYCSQPREYGIANYIRGIVLWKNIYPVEAYCAWKLTLDAFSQAIGQPDGEKKQAIWYKEQSEQLINLMRDLMEHHPDQPVIPAPHPRTPPGRPPQSAPPPQPSSASSQEVPVETQASPEKPPDSGSGSFVPPVRPVVPTPTPETLPVLTEAEEIVDTATSQAGQRKTMDEKAINWAYLLGLPVVGEVPAGGFGPTGVNGNAVEYADFDQVIINGRLYRFVSLDGDRQIRFDRKSDFLLRVVGNSMDRARPYEIKDGDYVLVHPQTDLADGRIVVAVISGVDMQGTLKRYQMRGGIHTLVPESSDPSFVPFEIKPDDPGEKAEISGIVLAILKPEK